MTSSGRHQVALDYLLDLDGKVSVGFIRQTRPEKNFSNEDKKMFGRRLPIVECSSGRYGLVLAYFDRDDAGLSSIHFVYEEGFKGEKLEINGRLEGKWKG